jgi:murein L,D-transpeptidase YcbB/YkuD
MERLRWLPDYLGQRYIMVNLANYQLTAVENEQVKLNMRVIVGKQKRSTPSFSGKITHVVFNPYWNVPHKLARLDLLPKQQANPDYLASHHFRVFSNETGNKVEVNPDTIDWQALSERYFPYTLRQEPGEKNALGRLKFIIPNPWAIYLHDTPSKSLFNHSRRTFSAGCIRVEDPLALASFSLGETAVQQSLTEILDTEDEYETKLEQPVTVYAIYSTIWFDGDDLIFSPDSYHRDQAMAKYF